MFWSSAAIAGTTAGGFAFLVIILGFYYCYVLRRRIPSNRNSDTGSSDPSTLGTAIVKVFLLNFLMYLSGFNISE